MLLDTPLCNFGWQAPDFSLEDANGQIHHLSDYVTDKGLLIAFICNHCPYVKAIVERFSSDCKTLIEQGFGVLAIMPNDYEKYPADSPTKMLEFAQQYQFTFPYLVDNDQSVARAYDAVCTPDFFGFNNKGELQYRGRIDDAKMEDASNRTPELLDAMRMVAETTKGPPDQQASMGCSIKWKS